MNFEKFKKEYSQQANKVDLEQHPLIYGILQSNILKLDSAELDSEIMEVLEFSEKAIKELKNKINTSILNEHYKGNYSNFTPPFIVDLKLYFEYKNLFDKVSEKINTPNSKQGDTEAINPHPDIFTGTDNKAFLLFTSFHNNHIIEPYIDFSFLFQRMKSKNEKLIQNVKHLDFMEWLKTNEYISEKVYDGFFEKGCFRSLNKSTSLQRENNYNLLKEKIF